MHRYCNSKHSGVFGIYELFDFLINFNSLPKDNVRKARKECQNILDNPRNSQTVRVCKLDYPVFPAPIHFRHLQIDKNKALLISQDYSVTFQLSPEAGDELVWWRDKLDNLGAWNRKTFVSGSQT
jgi:hypothetical protein